MASKKDTFEADDTISIERKAAKSNIELMTEKKASSTEKAPASDVFSGVLEKREEKKSRRMQLLLTEANFKILDDASKESGRSKNDLINRLISIFGKNTDL